MRRLVSLFDHNIGGVDIGYRIPDMCRVFGYCGYRKIELEKCGIFCLHLYVELIAEQLVIASQGMAFVRRPEDHKTKKALSCSPNEGTQVRAGVGVLGFFDVDVSVAVRVAAVVSAGFAVCVSGTTVALFSDDVCSE